MNDLPDDIFGCLVQFINRCRDNCSVCRVCRRWNSFFHLKHVVWRDVNPSSPGRNHHHHHRINSGGSGTRPPPFRDPAFYLIPRMIECHTRSVVLVSPFRVPIPQRLEDLTLIQCLQELHFNDYVVINPAVCASVAGLVKMPALTHLSMYFAGHKKKNCPLEHLAILLGIFQAPHLQVVDTSFLSCGLTDELVAMLVEHLFSSPSLTGLTLALYENGVSDHGVQSLQQLVHHPKIQTLEIQLQGYGFTADLRTKLPNGRMDFFSTAEVKHESSCDNLDDDDNDDASGADDENDEDERLGLEIVNAGWF